MKSQKKAYITLLGRSTWALVNTYHAVLHDKNYLPDLVFVVTEAPFEKELDKAVRAVSVLNAHMGISPEVRTHVVAAADYMAAGAFVQNTMKDLKRKGWNIALDATPGRKAMVVSSCVPAIQLKADHIYYLAISTMDDVAKPYMMIPLRKQRLLDLMENPAGGRR